MIHYFSVSNYYSIREEAVLDLRIPKTAPDLPHFRRSRANPDIRLPSVVALMGPNGSGKTTLLRALLQVIHFASTPWTTHQETILAVIRFLGKGFANEPTRFCVEFEADCLAPGTAPEIFRYQFSLRRGSEDHGSHTVFSEALLHFPKGRPRRLFERGESNDPIYVSGEFGIKPKDERLKAVRKDSSVISTFAFLNVPFAIQIVEKLQWLMLTTNIRFHENRTLPTEAIVDVLEKKPDLRRWVEKEIQGSDLAIQDMRLDKDIGGKGEISFSHQGLDRPIPLLLESGGTKRLFHLLPQIYIALANGVPAVLDEVDGDLHVDIVSEMFHRFRSQETNPHNAQLLVTSHNVGLLDDLEKEELFIVEKGEDSGTRVRGAQDVRGLRRDTKLYPKYRAGVLGGVPNLG